MINRVEFGNLNRSENGQILIKEKIGADGNPSVRIYQRKDVNSIENFKDRIKTTVKYSVEDFFIAHKKLQPLLSKIGFTKVNYLQTDGIKDPINLLQSIKSSARIGLVAQENKKSLQSILEKNGFDGDYQFNFYKGSYKNEDFFADLTAFVSQGNEFSSDEKSYVKKIENCFVNNYILHHREFQFLKAMVEKIEGKLTQHFSAQKILFSMSNFSDKNSAATSSSKDGTSTLDLLKSEIDSKLNEIKTRIRVNSTHPNNEVIKSNLLFILSDMESQNRITTNKAAETRGAIDILFSTSWWISDEKRKQSLEKIGDVFASYKENLAEALRYEIYPAQE